MPSTSLLSILTIPALACAIACGGGAEPPAEGGSGTDVPADTTPVSDVSPSAERAPADSVIAWAQEIREGIEPLAGQVGSDPEAARQRAVELYVTRQERIEQAAGPGTTATPDLAESVHEGEARFHELMQLLGASPPPDSAAVEGAVQALDERLAEVIELAGTDTMGSR